MEEFPAVDAAEELLRGVHDRLSSGSEPAAAAETAALTNCRREISERFVIPTSGRKRSIQESRQTGIWTLPVRGYCISASVCSLSFSFIEHRLILRSSSHKGN